MLLNDHFVKIFDKIGPVFVENFEDRKNFDKITSFFVEILVEMQPRADKIG